MEILLKLNKFLPLLENSVYVEGAVFLPGIYDLSKVSTVKELINSSSGLRPDANASAFLI